MKYKRKDLSSEEIGRLAALGCVLYVGERTLVLTLAFRRALYDAWEREPGVATVRKGLLAAGIDERELGFGLAHELERGFRGHGRPSRTNAPSAYDATVVPGAGLALEGGGGGYEARRALLASGDFATGPDGRIWPSPELEDALFGSWPERPVADGLAEAGYGERAARAGLAGRIEAHFADAASVGTTPAESRRACEAVDADALPRPFAEARGRSAAPTDALVAGVAPLLLAGATVDEALEAHLIGRRLLSVAEKRALAEAAAEASPTPEESEEAASAGGTLLGAAALRRRGELPVRAVESGLAEAAAAVPSMSPLERKALCLWVSSLPADPAGVPAVRGVISRLGVSKSSYYRHVGDESWGTSELARASRDAEDARAVREAFDYRGFRKGARQVCMLLPRLGHRRVGLRRVRRLMREQGLSCGVRAPNPARRSSAAFEAEAVAPNLLRRRFRLHRPNEVRVTDVTVLDYGDGLRAYGSALMDPVTSVLAAFVVSDRNDLDLAVSTLREGDAHPCEDGGVLHSDQGAPCKAGEFRAEALGRGPGRSMSKRGNCRYYATVESFFGHFKDECDYASCGTLEELRAMVGRYADYHNRERGMWDRMRMTPLEYEAYLSGLDEEGFADYLEHEEAEWKAMRERAAELARRRYGTLGA